MKNRWIALLVIIIFICFFNGDSWAQGCSQCRLIPQSDADGGGTVARSLNPAILYLMVVPYLMLAFIFRKQLAAVYKLLRARFS